MKQKWLALTIPQRVLFCLQAFLVVLFLILYSTVGKQQVLYYRDTTLRCFGTETATVYAGKLDGTSITFSVSENHMEYRYGDKVIHYTVLQDPSAIPAKETMEQMDGMHYALTGVEIRKDSDLLFRGAYLSLSNRMILFDENGTATNLWASSFSSDGNTSAKTIPDPSAATVLSFLYDPDVVQRANFMGLLCGMFLCVICMVSMLYADKLFRRNLRFKIRNAEDAEPSDWELTSRWIGWVTITCLALFIFILGLTGM